MRSHPPSKNDMELHGWNIIEGFNCRECGSPARQNPRDHREWGCAGCGLRTHSLWLNFLPYCEDPKQSREVDRIRELEKAGNDAGTIPSKGDSP